MSLRSVLLASLVAVPALAQEPPRAVEEIVVTAQKKEQSIEEVPISITALSGTFLKEAGIGGVHELVRHTPNVHFATSPCCSTIFIRGFGSPFQAGAFDPTVSLVLDEFSIPKDIYLSDPLYDVERFEVLRGPQGSLFGKNTPAGLFNVTTAGPTDEFTGTILGRLGTDDIHRVEAAFGGPLGPLGRFARFRFAVMDSKQTEDVLNTKTRKREPGTEQSAARLRLALEPLDGLDVLLTGDRAMTEAARTFSFQLYRLPESSEEFLRGFDPEFEDDGLNHQTSQDLPKPITRTTDRAQANVRYDLGELGPMKESEIVAVVGYTKFDADTPIDNDFSPADIQVVDPSLLTYEQKSAELRASGILPAPFLGEIEFLVGFLAFDSSYVSDLSLVGGEDLEEWLLSPAALEILTGSPAPSLIAFGSVASALAALGLGPSPVPPVLAGDGFRGFSDQGTRSYGIFGQASWHLTDQWTLSFGGRVTFEKKTADLAFTCFQPGVLCAALGGMDYTRDLSRRETNFSPKVTLQYFPWDGLALFATRATGFKSGGYNNLSIAPSDLEVEEESTVAYEVGAKGSFFDETLSYSTTLFHMDVEDLQVQQFLGGTSIVVRNAAGARSRGIELDVQWLTPWEPLAIRGAGALTDGEFKDFPDAPAPRSFGPGAEQDLSGERLPFLSERQLAVTPELRFPFDGGMLGSWLPRDLALTAALDVLYRSSVYLDVDLDPATLQDDFVLLNGRLSFSGLADALTLTVAVENIADADVLQFATDTPVFNGFMVLQEYGRTAYAELRYSW